MWTLADRPSLSAHAAQHVQCFNHRDAARARRRRVSTSQLCRRFRIWHADFSNLHLVICESSSVIRPPFFAISVTSICAVSPAIKFRAAFCDALQALRPIPAVQCVSLSTFSASKNPLACWNFSSSGRSASSSCANFALTAKPSSASRIAGAITSRVSSCRVLQHQFQPSDGPVRPLICNQ